MSIREVDALSALLEEVLAGLAGAHSDAAIARGLALALGRRTPLLELELGLAAPDGVSAASFTCGPEGAVVEAPRALSGTLAGAALAGTARPLGPPRAGEPAEVRRPRGVAQLTVLPVRPGTGPAAYLRLSFGPGPLPAGRRWPSAMAVAVAGALGQVAVLCRVAELSRRAHAEGRELRERLRTLDAPGSLVGRSPGIEQVRRSLALVAPLDTTVLILGESGTGKELVARQLHAASGRALRPMLAVNCGALPETLLESVLFGHERGAFTGAQARRLGLFERADRSTLFLDEVGELPLAAQARLLRVLQEGELERVGGERTLQVDVRVVAATHRDLEAQVRAGRFREDLYWRLNVFPLQVPPLRERPEDLPLLAEALLARLAARHHRTPPRLTPAALARLRRHSWPGNVRELENALERALVLSPGAELALGELATASVPAPVAAFREASREAITRALRASGGQLYGPGGAAELLGLKPTTLQSKMKVLGLRRADFARR